MVGFLANFLQILVCLVIVSLAQNGNGGNGGNLNINFAAAAPCTYYHETGGGAFNDGTIGTGGVVETLDIREELEGKHWKCGDYVTFLLKVIAAPPTECMSTRFTLTFDSDTTGQSGVAFDKVMTAKLNLGDVQNGAGIKSTWGSNEAPQYNRGRFIQGGGINTCNWTQEIAPPLTDYGMVKVSPKPNCQGQMEVQVVSEKILPTPADLFKKDGYIELIIDVKNVGEYLPYIIRIDVRLACGPTQKGATGNLLSKIMDAYHHLGDGITNKVPVQVGSQTIPLKLTNFDYNPPSDCNLCGRDCSYCGDRGHFNPNTCECECYGSWEHPHSSQPDCSTCSAFARSCMNGSTFNLKACSCDCNAIGTTSAWTGGRCQTCDTSYNCGNGVLNQSTCSCNCTPGSMAIRTSKGPYCVAAFGTCPIEQQNNALYFSLDTFLSTKADACSFFPGKGIAQTVFDISDGKPDNWLAVFAGQPVNIIDSTGGTRLFVKDAPGKNFFHHTALQKEMGFTYTGNHNQGSCLIADNNAKLESNLNKLLNPNSSKSFKPNFCSWQAGTEDEISDFTDLLSGFAATAYAKQGCNSDKIEPYIFFGLDRKSEGSFPTTLNCLTLGKSRVINTQQDKFSYKWSFSEHRLASLYRDHVEVDQISAYQKNIGTTGDLSVANTVQVGTVLASAECNVSNNMCSLSFLIQSADDCYSFNKDTIKVILKDSTSKIVGSDCGHNGATFDSSQPSSNICSGLDARCNICSKSTIPGDFHFIQFENVLLGQYTIEVQAQAIADNLSPITVRTPPTCLNLQLNQGGGQPASSSVSWWFNQKEIIPVDGYTFPYSPCKDNFNEQGSCKDFAGVRTMGDLLISAEITENADYSDLNTGTCNLWDIAGLKTMKMRPRVQMWACTDVENCQDPLVDITNAVATDILNACLAQNDCNTCKSLCGNPLVCNGLRQCPYSYLCVTTNTVKTDAMLPHLIEHSESRTFFEGGLKPHTLQKLLAGFLPVVSPCWPGLCYGQIMFASRDGLGQCGSLRDFIFPDSFKRQYCIDKNNQISRNGLMKCIETASCLCDGVIELSSILSTVKTAECLCADCLPIPSQPPLVSISPSSSSPPSNSPTSSITGSVTPSGSKTPSSSVSSSSSNTPSSFPTPSPTPSSSLTASSSRTPTSSNTPTTTVTPTSSVSPSSSNSATVTSSNSQTPSASASPTLSNTSSGSITPSKSRSITPSASISDTPGISHSPSSSVTPSVSQSSSQTASPTVSLTASVSLSPSSSITPTASQTASTSVTSSSSPTSSQSLSPSSSESPSATKSPTPTTSATVSASMTPSQTPSQSPSVSPTSSQSRSSFPSQTPTTSMSLSPSAPASVSSSPTPSKPFTCPSPKTCPNYYQTIKGGKYTTFGSVKTYFQQDDYGQTSFYIQMEAISGKEFIRNEVALNLVYDYVDGHVDTRGQCCMTFKDLFSKSSEYLDLTYGISYVITPTTGSTFTSATIKVLFDKVSGQSANYGTYTSPTCDGPDMYVQLHLVSGTETLYPDCCLYTETGTDFCTDDRASTSCCSNVGVPPGFTRLIDDRRAYPLTDFATDTRWPRCYANLGSGSSWFWTSKVKPCCRCPIN